MMSPLSLILLLATVSPALATEDGTLSAEDTPPVVIPTTPPPPPQPHEDGRCRCVCPTVRSMALLNATSSDEAHDVPDPFRQVYVKSDDAARQCGCESVVLPQLRLSADAAAAFSQKFCPRCVCKYERRNTGVIKVVVIFVLGVIAMLSLYMGFLLCLDPLFKRNRLLAYQAQTDDEGSGSGTAASSADEAAADEAVSMAMREAPGSGVLHRVGHQQSKWQRTVQEQRRNVYDRSSILN